MSWPRFATGNEDGRTDDELEADGAELGRGDELAEEEPAQVAVHGLVDEDARELGDEARRGDQEARGDERARHFAESAAKLAALPGARAGSRAREARQNSRPDRNNAAKARSY